jgi:hypothetical protein
MTYSVAPLSPLVSPTGLVTYDFETMVTRVAKSIGSSDERYDNLNVFSVPFLLHTCTKFGQSLAKNRALRVRLAQGAFENTKRQLPIALAHNPMGAPGLDLDVVYSQNNEIKFSYDWDHDRIRSLVELWGSALIAEWTYLEMEGSEGAGVDNQQRKIAFQEVLLSNSKSAKTSQSSYYSEFANSKLIQVRYEGATPSPIETKDLIRCYMVLVELLEAGRSASPEMRGAFDAFRGDPSFACAEMAAYIFSRVATPFEILHICPEILLAIEYALGFPSLDGDGFDSEKHPEFPETYPPCRFVKALEYLAELNISIGIERPSLKQFQEASSALFSMKSGVFCSVSRSESSDSVSSEQNVTLGAPRRPSNSDWSDWFSYLAAAASNRILSHFSCLTEFFIFGLDNNKSKRDELGRKFEFAPFIVDQESWIFASSYFRADEHVDGKDALAMSTSFLQTNLSTYWLNDFMLGKRTPRAFPYYLPKEILFDRWIGTTEAEFFDSLIGRQPAS